MDGVRKLIASGDVIMTTSNGMNRYRYKREWEQTDDVAVRKKTATGVMSDTESGMVDAHTSGLRAEVLGKLQPARGAGSNGTDPALAAKPKAADAKPDETKPGKKPKASKDGTYGASNAFRSS